jgi:hypothetical protein
MRTLKELMTTEPEDEAAQNALKECNLLQEQAFMAGPGR